MTKEEARDQELGDVMCNPDNNEHDCDRAAFIWAIAVLNDKDADYRDILVAQAYIK